VSGHDQTGFAINAAIGQGGGGACQLQHGEGVVPLSNAQRNSFTAIPTLLLRFFIRFLFPVCAGQGAAQLAWQIDPRDLAESKWFHEVMNGVYAHGVGQ
jgi:hypothetical protein